MEKRSLRETARKNFGEGSPGLMWRMRATSKGEKHAWSLEEAPKSWRMGERNKARRVAGGTTGARRDEKQPGGGTVVRWSGNNGDWRVGAAGKQSGARRTRNDGDGRTESVRKGGDARRRI